MLYGVLPEALLTQYRFWQDEADQLRGYPIDAPRATMSYSYASTKARTSRAMAPGLRRLQSRGMALPPVRVVVIRMKRARMQRLHAAVLKALEKLQEFVTQKELLVDAFKHTFGLGQKLSLLLPRLCGHFFGGDADADAALADFGELLKSVDVTTFKRRQQRHRTSEVLMPSLVDTLLAMAERVPPKAARAVDASGKGDGAQQQQQQGGAASVSDIEQRELVLLDLLAAPKGSRLESLASVLARVDSLAHVLAWARYDEATRLHQPDALGHDDLEIVSLPRLKLTFQARKMPRAGRCVSTRQIMRTSTSRTSATH